MRKLVLFLLLGVSALAQSLELETIMADPVWIGQWPQESAWHPDGRTVLFRRAKPKGGEEIVRLDRQGKTLGVTAAQSLPRHRPGVASWDGDLYREGSLLTQTVESESEAYRLADGRVVFERERQLFTRSQDGTEIQLGDFLLEELPSQPEGFLAQQQHRYFEVLRQRRRRELAGPHKIPQVYLGDEVSLVVSRLALAGRHCLVVLGQSDQSGWDKDKMPHYVTRSGYMESEEVRARVGTGEPDHHTLRLYTLPDWEFVEVSLDQLPGRHQQPLRVEQVEPLNRGFVVQVFSQDHHDRWLLRLDASGSWTLLEHLHDPAWHSWSLNDVGILPGSERVYYLSEKSGYSQLYLEGQGQLTRGPQVVENVTASPDGRFLYYTANPVDPAHYNVFRVSTENGEVEQVTKLGGLTEYQLSLDGETLLLRHSRLARPPELYLQEARPRAPARQLTQTVSDRFQAIDWTVPSLVQIPSSHHSRPIYGRFYPAATEPSGKRPAVVFVHGAGYLQNSHAGWSYYFREFMFHTLLNRLGFCVLDLDYRASAGYGREWRTAIYRQMGTPELEDLADGVDWLVENHQVDRHRVGVYGGSYGGFLTLMALFREPDLFACGAALRPVTDWAHYNDPYTSRILNTPGEDPKAYRVSSPIEYAEGLSKPLLMAHGMLDDNVFAQDTIRLAQRLIELKKENWEMALYPLEGHGFEEPTSWLDQYRRILKLFLPLLEAG